MMELTPEILEFVEDCIEHVVTHLARQGWRPPNTTTVKCLWCAERMTEDEWMRHRPRCPSNPRVRRNQERLQRLKRVVRNKKQVCVKCNASGLLNDRGLCLFCAEPSI